MNRTLAHDAHPLVFTVVSLWSMNSASRILTSRLFIFPSQRKCPLLCPCHMPMQCMQWGIETVPNYSQKRLKAVPLE